MLEEAVPMALFVRVAVVLIAIVAMAADKD
jgi:hypothetical protein